MLLYAYLSYLFVLLFVPFKINIMEITTAIILETRKQPQNNNYPVKIRVTYNRQCHYYTIRNIQGKSIYLTKIDFSKVMGERPREKYKELRHLLNANEKKARNVIKEMPVFTFKSFESKFFGITEDNKDVITCLRNKADTLRAEGRISTAVSYGCATRSLIKFIKKEHLDFENVNIPFLNDYEKWMLSENNSTTTIGIYLRNLRAVFRDAEKKGYVKQGIYPFGKDKYVIPSGRNIKKALTLHEVGLIAKYMIKEGTSECRYRDYWLFSYLCNGINVKDITQLKYSNISKAGDIISFVRAKTQRETKGNVRPITIAVTKEIGRIIDIWGNKSGNHDTYIFPILEKGLTPEQQYYRIQRVTKLINKYMGGIAEKLELKNKVTSYTARHSFATVLKRSGASIEYISESLGHSNIATTENYLADFEIEEKRKWAEKLTAFDN